MKYLTYFLMLLPVSLFGQIDCGEEVAKIFRKTNYIEETTSTSEIQRVYFTSSEEELDKYADQYEKGDNLDGAYKAVAITWSKNRKRSNYREQWRSKKQEYEFESDIRGDFWRVTVEESLSESDAREAYRICVENRYGDATAYAGVYYELLGDVSDAYRTLRLSKVPKPLASTEVRIKNVSSTNISFDNSNSTIKKGLVIKDWEGIAENLRLQDPEEKGIVNIEFQGFPVYTIIVPARKKLNNIPVGTIISSVLEYPQLCAQLDEQAPANGDYSTVSFAPCDGREIKNSYLSEIGKTYAPDLRGQFIRGKNQIYGPDEPNKYANGNDPDNASRIEVKSYSYQSDTLETHRHGGVFDASGSSLGDSRELNYSSFNGYTGYTGGKETRPRNISLFFYIKLN